MIRKVLKDRGMTVVDFAHALSCTRENAHRILTRSNIDIVLLARISVILEHDFFLDLSECDTFGHSDNNGHTNPC